MSVEEVKAEPTRVFYLPRKSTRGVIGGVTWTRLGVLVPALVVVIGAVGRGPVGLAVAVIVAVTAGVVVFVPIGGRVLADYALPGLRWAQARVTGQVEYRGAVGHGHGVVPPDADWLDLPGALYGARVLDVAPSTAVGLPGLAVFQDQSAGTMTVACLVGAPPFLLLDLGVRDTLVEQWSGLLAVLSRTGSPVARLSVVTLTEPGVSKALEDYYQRHHSSLSADYLELLHSMSETASHRTVVALTVPRRAGIPTLLGEAALLARSLEAARFTVDRWLGPEDYYRLIRDAYSPDRFGARADHPNLVGPMATSAGWGSFVHDGAVSRTLEVVTLPAFPVPAGFLTDLVLAPGVRRRVAFVCAPVDRARARRKVRAQRTDDGAAMIDRDTLVTADQTVQATDAMRAEQEMAQGAGYMLHAVYLTVTADDLDALDREVAAVVQVAGQHDLTLVPVWGAQQDAYTWTLPLGRGIGSTRALWKV